MEKDVIRRIVVDPKIMVGKPIIKGTRITVYEIVNRVAQGQSFEAIEKDLEIGRDDIKAALAYAGNLAEDEDIFPLIAGN
ncbi:DUF433 domain-containing protein [Candidatus Woesearchaeota archaeon]|nr:DUF433 domain-containing protein [Candidatus Woesearchaeota archaeon]